MPYFNRKASAGGKQAFAVYRSTHSSGTTQATFSNIQVTIHDALAEGDKVLLRWSCRLTHTGDGLGVRATGKTNRGYRHVADSDCGQ